MMKEYIINSFFYGCGMDLNYLNFGLVGLRNFSFKCWGFWMDGLLKLWN